MALRPQDREIHIIQCPCCEAQLYIDMEDDTDNGECPNCQYNLEQ